MADNKAPAVQHIPDTRTWSTALWLWSPWHKLSVAHSHCRNDQKNRFQCPFNIYIMYHSNVSFENDKQGLTVRIFLCEGQCRLWFSGCGLQSREYHPQWTSSPNLLAGAYHSAAWGNQMHQTNRYKKNKCLRTKFVLTQQVAFGN